MSIASLSPNAKKWIGIGTAIVFVVLSAIFGEDVKGLVCECPSAPVVVSAPVAP